MTADVANPLQHRREVDEIAQREAAPQRPRGARRSAFRLIRNAEVRNESAFRMKTVSRPKNAATTPPIAALQSEGSPTTSLKIACWRPALPAPAAMLGITELRAGSKNAAIVVSASSNGYTSHTIDRERTNNIAITTAKRMMSAAIITCLRFSRSFTTPAVGPTKVCGSTCSIRASATEPGVPGQLQQQRINRQRVKPVANFADDLRHPEPAEIAIASQQLGVGTKRDGWDNVFRLRFHAGYKCNGDNPGTAGIRQKLIAQHGGLFL